jgi:hypothetical protein
MKRFVRVGLTVGALLLGLLVAGCEDFDPTALFDSEIFNSKKKLPGERQPVFPEGTPGVSQGVPPDLVKGYHPPPEPAAAPKQAAAEPTEPKPRPKLKPKPKVVSQPPDQSTASAATAPPTQGAPQAAQWPDQSQTQQAPAAAPAWPGSARPSGGVAWPDPPAPR